MSDPQNAGVPTFQGRVLPRPHGDIVDQGLAFDLATIDRRRRAAREANAMNLTLGMIGLGRMGGNMSRRLARAGHAVVAWDRSPQAGTTASSASSTSATSATLTEIPEETAGPYPGDGSNGPDVLGEAGVVRQDITTSFGAMSGTAQGVPARIELTILDVAKGNAPFAGAAVYVWHCDREGGYSLYSDGVTDQNYLRGVQIAGADGTVAFTSIFPACYSGRWPHVHFEVYPDQASITDAGNAIAVSQLAIPRAECDAVYATPGYEQSVANFAGMQLATDNVFRDDGGAGQLASMSGDAATGYTMSLTAAVDTRT